MQALSQLADIQVPPPQPDREFRIQLFDREYQFTGLKRLLAAADYSKSGDRGAGLAASSEVEREAARAILSDVTLAELYDWPLTDETGRVDSVMRVNYDIDLPRYQALAPMTVGQLKDYLLREPADKVQAIGPALTGVMAAAVAKLMDTHELILAARKISQVTHARTTLGRPGTLSSRLQPNHPVDDLRGITLLTYIGLSLGAGDALIGVNPAEDTVENVSAILRHLDQIRQRTQAPTQICVLGHVKTQLACLQQGAPVEIMFQSLAGTEATNLTEFDISVELLDLAYETMRECGPLGASAQNFMYFETGQGSEYTYGKHNGIDMATTEALCYGLARRWRPFMVNNVTGFIGPETHRDNFEMIISNLQDHFMGKLLGLPMGMAPCYTLHSQITLEGQQMATQLLAGAGANYYMDVYLNTDRMLAYFDTSGHDDQTLREIHGRQPAAEYLAWANDRGIYAKAADGGIIRGPNWGQPEIFCESPAELAELRRATPALYGFENSGPRPANSVSRQLKANHAVAREAISSDLQIDELCRLAPFRVVTTRADNRENHLAAPELGARLSAASLAELTPENCDVQIVISDGLSAAAVHANVEQLLPILNDGLAAWKVKTGQPIAARFGRVKLAEQLAERLQTRLTILLIGERPGGDAASSRSLSAYLVLQLLDDNIQALAAQFSGNHNIRFEYSVISNIYDGGIPPVEAGSVIAEKAWQILDNNAAGNRLATIID